MKDASILSKTHQQRYQATPSIYAAPGRVNLIGEHTDYAEGFVMPAAIDYATLAAISPRTDGKVVLYAENYGEERTFDAASLPTQNSGDGHWSNYPLGVLSILASEGHTIPAFSLTLWGDVPNSAGLSSSASVEVATMSAVAALLNLDVLGSDLPGPKLARLCQRVENEFVGANSGIMDQFISANGKADNALLLDCRYLTYELAPIPHSVALVIANTMVKHSVAGGEYTERRAQVEEAASIIARHRPEVRFLRDATVEDLAKWGHEIPPVSLKRARHVITENDRTVAAAKALKDHDLKTLGRLMHEAHISYSQDFEASCPEADLMVDLAQNLPGLIGARLTGGGFGGCTINLVEQEHAESFASSLKKRYDEATSKDAQVFICHASDGAHKVA